MRKILFTILLCVCMFSLQSNSKRMEHKVPEFMTAKNPTPELVYQCARYYGLQHAHVVVAQSILELVIISRMGVLSIIIYSVYMTLEIRDIIVLTLGNLV